MSCVGREIELLMEKHKKHIPMSNGRYVGAHKSQTEALKEATAIAYSICGEKKV